jgi:NAD(P)H-hydrate repair Nnr-like enzyme with NAD(P)H-hydrate epimerase domain
MEKATHTIRFATLQSTSANEIPLDQIKNQQPDLVLDALIGYGEAAPKGQVAELIASTAPCRAPALAPDVPSGVAANERADSRSTRQHRDGR